MVEQRSPKPRAEGSSPSAPAKKKKSRFTALFSFSFVQTVLKTRHAERVEGCGSPVETSARSAEAPTEPAGETKSFCPCQKEKESFYGSFFFFVCANGSENKARGACRGVRVSGGDLCTKCRSTDRAGRRDQVLLPLPKRNSHRFGDCFFFVRQNLLEARACRASSPSAAGGR